MDDFACMLIVLLPVLPAFWFAARVREIMAARHMEIWFRTEQGRNIPVMLTFLWSNEHRRLGDPDMSRRIWRYRVAMVLGAVAMPLVAGLTSIAVD